MNHRCGQLLNLSQVSIKAARPVDKGKLLKEYFHWGYPYATIGSLLEKRRGVRMHMRMLNRKLKNRPRKLRPAQSPAHKIIDRNIKLTQNICSSSQLLIKSMFNFLEKNIKRSQCLANNLRTKSKINYTIYKNLKNLLRQLLSCKITYTMQLKNLTHWRVKSNIENKKIK